MAGSPALIVDAHVYFWRLARGDNTALDPGMRPLYRDHEPAGLRPLLDACGIERVVLVQAAETLAENLYTLGLALATPWIAGVVGWIDLASASLGEDIAALAATGQLIGFRPVRDDNRSIAWLLDARHTPGLERVASAGLALDLLVQNPDELPLVTHLAARHPDLSIVLDHCGKPDIRGGRLALWASDVAALAAHGNVACKLSGLPNRAPPGASAAVLQPFADRVLELFGPERTMWASDWPPVLLACEYARWWEISRDLLSGLARGERDLVLGGTAARIYRLSGNERRN